MRLLQHVRFRLLPHSNANALSIAHLLESDWQCVVKTSDWLQDGEGSDSVREGLYVGLDALLDPERPEFAFLRANATKTLADGRPGARIKTIRLRGALSQGLLIRLEPWMRDHVLADGSLDLEAISKELRIERYEPPIPMELRGEMVRAPGSFVCYPSIENGKNVRKMFEDGEQVIVTEKLHGTNFRVGLADQGLLTGPTYFVGSHATARNPEGTTLYASMARRFLNEEAFRRVAEGVTVRRNFIVYGEIIGHKVQDLTYGCQLNEQTIRIFDVLIDDVWQSHENVEAFAKLFGVQTVPVLYRGPFSHEKIREHRDGASTMPRAKHVREGVVVKPAIERHTALRDAQDRLIYQGRAIAKYISDDYLERSHAKDGH